MSLVHFLKFYVILNIFEMGLIGNIFPQNENSRTEKGSENAPVLKIGLIADPQYCDCEPAGTRFYRESLKRIPEALDTFNNLKVDFVMNLGDMIDKYENSYDSVIKFYSKLKMPFYNLLGNHEFEDVSGDYLSTLLERYKMPDFYYDFSYNNWRFIVLDGSELGEYSRYLHPDLLEEGDSLWHSVKGKINDLPWNGGISQRQQMWLKSRLAIALGAQQNVIVFCHFPVYPESIDLTLWNRNQIIEILEKYPNVITYISGHYHEGGYGYKKGIHYVTQKAMVDTPDKNSFAVLEICADEIRIKGFGDIADRLLPYVEIRNR
jgi:manganese-dependent ADP-ribose/CDP-alcohol diphosphatase